MSLPGSAVTHTDANAEVGWAYSSVESRVVVEGGAILTHRTPWSYVEERREPDRQLPSIGVLLDHVVQPVCVRVECMYVCTCMLCFAFVDRASSSVTRQV